MVFGDEQRVEVQRPTPEGWKLEDLIGQAVLDLACCTEPIPLQAVYRDLFSEREDPAPASSD